MKKVKHSTAWLLFFFLIAVLFRLSFVISLPSMSDDISYGIVRQVEHIQEKGVPIVHDELSYGGRTHVGSPVYYYGLSFIDSIVPLDYFGKVFTNIFASCIIFFVYLIAKEITGDERIALFAGVLSIVIPIYVKATLNTVSPISVTVPLFFACIYALLTVQKNWSMVPLYLGMLIIFSVLSPMVFLLILCFIMYVALTKSVGLKITKEQRDLMIFSVFFIVWSQFLIFKKVFFLHGVSIVWQNTPNLLLTNYFFGISLADMVVSIGLIPLLVGIAVVYKYVYYDRDLAMNLLVSMVLLFGILLLGRLIEPQVGLIFLAITLVILFAKGFKLIELYALKTKIPFAQNILFVVFCGILIISALIPTITLANSVVHNAYSDEEMEALVWIKENTESDAVVLGSLDEGNLIAGVAKRKNVVDSSFLYIEDINERVEDLDKLFNARYQSNALELLDKYEVDYMYISHRTRSYLAISKLAYINEECFELQLNTSVEIYKIKCTLI